ncbi:MAG: hypothetical protein WDM77_15745 [Steroidobacteraceae bacterium]
MLARQGEITLLGNVALALEYEATCRRAEHVLRLNSVRMKSRFSSMRVIAMLEPVESHFVWRPMLRGSSR